MGSVRIDITAPPKSTEASRTFVIEEVIIPPQVDEYKPAFHREYLCRWLVGPEAASGFTLEDVWKIREACIAELSRVSV